MGLVVTLYVAYRACGDTVSVAYGACGHTFSVTYLPCGYTFSVTYGACADTFSVAYGACSPTFFVTLIRIASTSVARGMWKNYFSGHGQGHPTPQKQQQQRNKKTPQQQDTTVWTSVSSELLSFLLWNIVWQFIIVSFSLLWKKKKATTTKKDCCVQGHSTGQWMFVRTTFSELLDPFCNQTQCGDVPHHYKPKCRVCMSQWGLMYQSMMFSTIFCEVMIRLRTLIYEPLQWPWWPRP